MLVEAYEEILNNSFLFLIENISQYVQPAYCPNYIMRPLVTLNTCMSDACDEIGSINNFHIAGEEI